MLLDRTRNTWSIEVRIAAQNTMGRGDGESNAGVSLLVSKCNEKSFLKSKHSIDHVASFLKGYDECTTKAAKVKYCRELGDQCISLDEQVDAVICAHLENSNLGFYPADGTDEQVLVNAMGRLKRVITMTRPRMSCISIDNVSVINSNYVLSRIKDLRPTGHHAIYDKTSSSSAAVLRNILKQITNLGKNGKDRWPSSYYKVRKGINPKKDRVGEAVISIEEMIVKIVIENHPPPGRATK